MNAIHLLILEDEIPAYNKLMAYLTDFLKDAFTFDHARTVQEGIAFLETDKPYDLILSDIKLLDGSAFEIFQTIETPTPIIFCTAYDAHLLEAFQTNGIAYILKPYLKEDFEKALHKFQNLFEHARPEKALFKELKDLLKTSTAQYKRRFTIKKREGITLLETTKISFIQAQGDFCQLTDTDGRLHSISQSIGNVFSELNPKMFFRINRSQIVNISHIEKIRPYSKNRLQLHMKGYKDPVNTSSNNTKEFRDWLEQ